MTNINPTSYSDTPKTDSRRSSPNDGIINKAVLEEKVQHIRDSARDVYTRGKDKVQAMEEGFEDYVKERPIKSILVAAGIGVLIGFFLRRR